MDNKKVRIIIHGIYEEFIQLEIATIKKILEIEKDIVFMPNLIYWDYFFPDKRIPNRTIFGEALQSSSYIFLNPKKTVPLKELKITIWHELLHIKYPNKTEWQIRKLTKRFIN